MGHSFIVGFSYAIRAVRNIVDSYISRGSTTNLCAIDLSKAFDKVNHDALFLKLMKRLIPIQLFVKLIGILVIWMLLIMLNGIMRGHG